MIYWEKAPVPVLEGEFHHVYIPQPDYYDGEDTDSFKKGVKYEKWLTNDFSIIKGADGCWHLIGITHPWPPRFENDFVFDEITVHEAEWQLYHAVSKEKSLKDCLYRNSFEERGKILYPKDRPGEQSECWAPAVIRFGEGYKLVYSPKTMRTAYSEDLFHWEITGSLFSGHEYMRDPYVYFEDGTYYMLYVEEDLLYRTSTDFHNWSEPAVLQKNIFGAKSSQESPCLFKKDGYYYLLWCIYDGTNGCYDNRTFVFAGKTIQEFNRHLSPLTILKGHASEIFQDEDGGYYFATTYYPENGVSIAKLKFTMD